MNYILRNKTVQTLADLISSLHGGHGSSVPVRDKRWFRFGRVVAWLWLEDEGPTWSVTLASGETKHDTSQGPAYAIDVNKRTGEVAQVWKSALSMWPVHEPEKRTKAISLVVGALRDVAGEPTRQ